MINTEKDNEPPPIAPERLYPRTGTNDHETQHHTEEENTDDRMKGLFHIIYYPFGENE